MRTALRCPMCGTMNPVGNVYCEKCYARLIPMAAPPPEEPEREQAPASDISPPAGPPEKAREEEPQIEETQPEETDGGDWLAQLRASAEEEEIEEPETAEEPVESVDLPDWLRDMGPIGAGTQVEEPAVEPGFEEEAPPIPPPAEEGITRPLHEKESAEVPAWLRDMGPIGTETQVEGPEVEPSAEPDFEEEAPAIPPSARERITRRLQEPEPAEVPEWLRGLAPPEAAPTEEPAPAAPAPAPAEVPEWLREIAPPEVAPAEAAPATAAPPTEAPTPEAAPPTFEAPPEEPTPAAPAPAPGEVPDWLREIAPPEAAPAEAAPAEAAPPTEAPTPEAAPPTFEAPPEEPAPAAPAPAPGKVPDWLREIAPPEAAPATETAPAVPPLAEVPAEADITEVPDWLARVQAEPGAPSAPVSPILIEGEAPSPPLGPEAGVTGGEELAPAAIPDWLEDLRPVPEELPASIEEEPEETEGLLAGLRGVLPPIPAFKTPDQREDAQVAGEVGRSRAELLQSLLTRPTEAPRPEARKRGVTLGERIQRWLMAAVLLIATLSTSLAPRLSLNIPSLTQPLALASVTRAYDAIQGISAGDSVLVAFEYGPAEADELDLVAEPMLRHLLDRGAQIYAASTQPEGQAVAEAVLSTLDAPRQQFSLHYKPGDATGVSQMLAEAGTPQLVLVLTARPGPLRWWVEQTTLHSDTIPILGGMSTALESAASPYLDVSASQMQGAIYGLSGAASYERLGGSTGQATQRLDALALGHLSIVGLMILGAVFYALRGLRRRAK